MIPSLVLPLPPSDSEWCAACVMLFKGECLQDPKVQEEFKRITEMPGEGTEPLRVARFRTILDKVRLSVTTGPNGLLNGVVTPVCWDHVMAAAVNPKAPPARRKPLVIGHEGMIPRNGHQG